MSKFITFEPLERNAVGRTVIIRKSSVVGFQSFKSTDGIKYIIYTTTLGQSMYRGDQFYVSEETFNKIKKEVEEEDA